MSRQLHPIRLDWSSETVVTYCTECPEWSRLAFDEYEAFQLAAVHEQAAHRHLDKYRHALAVRVQWRVPSPDKPVGRLVA